jgi:hypothetical protein
MSTSTRVAFKLARIDNIKERLELLSTRYLQKATNSNQLIKKLIGNHKPNFKPRIKKSVKPILGHLLPKTTQSTAQAASISQTTATTSINQQKTKKKDNWQKLIDFVDQLDL